MHHADPEQRERRNELRHRAGVPAAGNPISGAGVVEGFQGLPGEPVVARHSIRDEGLDAGVAHILELLVVRGVHVGFMGVEACGAPTDLPDFGEFRIGGLEGGAFLERVSGEVGSQGLQLERLGRGLNVEVQIAPCAPP